MEKRNYLTIDEIKLLNIKYNIIDDNFYYYENRDHIYIEWENKDTIFYKIIINWKFAIETERILVFSPEKFIYQKSHDILFINWYEHEWYIKENDFIEIDTDNDWNFIESKIYTFTEDEIYKLNKMYNIKKKWDYSLFEKIKNLFSN